ncbi:hypothetical protein Tco_0861223 [Tanacetum coccineum]|uniref:Uncharacterized protein n=1 Tax=Tanacetum coccineum TaxID=301880 RepID=A0ABQ5BH62_9ASTR
MHHSMCSSTSNLVFMTLVLSLWAIPPVVPLIPTFIAINLLTCPHASSVVSSIIICRSPTITDQMTHYVAPVAFGRTWTIMMIVAFRTQQLGPAVIFLLPVPCSVSFASILPLVRLLLVLIVLGSVIQLPLVLSLAFGKSADLFVHPFMKLHYWTLTHEVSQTSTLITGVSSLIPSSISNALYSKLEWTGASVRYNRRVAKLGAPPHRPHFFSTYHHVCLSSDDLSIILSHPSTRCQQDPPLGHPYTFPDTDFLWGYVRM